VGEEVDGSNALRVIVCPTTYSKRKHTRREKYVKCCDAALTSMQFGKCMKGFEAGLKCNEIFQSSEIFVIEWKTDQGKDENAEVNDSEALMFDLDLRYI
jgi:hypothetical protein